MAGAASKVPEIAGPAAAAAAAAAADDDDEEEEEEAEAEEDTAGLQHTCRKCILSRRKITPPATELRETRQRHDGILAPDLSWHV